jgi:acetyl esterase/lipase
MTLWPEEYEDFRAEARAAAEVAASRMGAPPASAPEPTDPAALLAAGRAMISSLYVTSRAGGDEVLSGVPCRVFRPRGRSRGTYLHFHGGAMTMGSPLLNDEANAALCENLGVRVVSVDYRLAPEHPYPAAFDDGLSVAELVLSDEPGAIVVGGASAGAYLAVVTLLRVRDEVRVIERFSGANLVYGVYDLSGTPSHRGARPSDGPDILRPQGIDSMRTAFLPGRSREDSRDPALSPLYARLHELPGALFTVGFSDHLLDDTLFMEARWRAYGGATELAVYPDCWHGFLTEPVELTKRATQRMYDFLDRCFTR